MQSNTHKHWTPNVETSVGCQRGVLVGVSGGVPHLVGRGL